MSKTGDVSASVVTPAPASPSSSPPPATVGSPGSPASPGKGGTSFADVSGAVTMQSTTASHHDPHEDLLEISAARKVSASSSASSVGDEARDVVDPNDDLEDADRRLPRLHTRLKSTMLDRYSSMDTSNLEALLSGGLDRFYGKYKNAWKKNNLSFPTPEISFEDLSYSVRVSARPSSSKGSIGGFIRSMIQPWDHVKMDKVILHPMSGTIRPGTMTLVLANPGAGKSTLLKALAGKLKASHGRTLKGNITYSGLAAEEIMIPKLVGLVDQSDNHFPTLTVRETIQFADRCLNGLAENQPEKLREVARLRTDLCLHILGLSKCADTVVGDAMLRGVSGGERKRVTLGEMLVGGQSVFLCDEVSTGLDSAATFDIMKSLRSWTRTLGGSAVVALLQPPPEVVDLFDDVLIMTEGRLVYHGPTKDMVPYFRGLGFGCPAEVDPAEFVVDVVCGRGAQYLLPRGDGSSGFQCPKPPRRAQQFEDAFQRSDGHLRVLSNIEEKKKAHQNGNNLEMKSVEHLLSKRSSQKTTYGSSFLESTSLVLNRQKKIWSRDRALVYGKLFEALFMGVLLGIIFLDCPKKLYLRMCFFCIGILQRHGWQQLTIAFNVRNVFYKQRSRNFFRTLSYTIAESIVQIPLNLAVSLLISVIFYFMSGLARSASTFIVFHIIIVSFQHAILAYFSMITSFAPSLTIAQAAASLSSAFFLLFAGNIILPLLIPKYWIWMFWFTPPAWAIRSVLLNEFHSRHYSVEDREMYLDKFQINHGPEFIWIGILVLIAYYVIFTLLSTAALRFLRYETQSTAGSSAGAVGDSYSEAEEQKSTASVGVIPMVNAATSGDVVVAVDKAPSSAGDKDGAPVFIPAYLAVRDLKYFVPHPAKKGEELQLLQGITATFMPGTMTALMGSSGAGKTTFMDVLAGRKTGGRITGEILVNGEPKDPATFSRIAGYCEQMDIHSGGATIKEALEFSARLRLPGNTTEEARAEIVRTTMELLELDGLATELVRNCSIEQKKRVTIGVEVVANPSIIFLDEPTSGLDARAASIVMQGVRTIAKRTGRTIVCTIHQPSKAIFELFDSLLLLQKGGFTVFFGELGTKSEYLINYLASIPGTPPMPNPTYNPATYMLEVVGAGIGRQSRDYSVEYANSPLYQKNKAKADAIATGTTEDGQVMTKFSTQHLTPIASGFGNQFFACAKKMRLTYWRNPQYNLVRIVAFPVYALIFGTTFYRLKENTQGTVNSHVGLMYNTLDFIGIINLMTVLDTVSLERSVYYRERMSNYYGPLPYSLSLMLAEVPYLLVTSFVFMNVEYWLVGWLSNATGFFLFWFVFFLHTSIATSCGQLMAVLMPNIKVANVAVGALSVFFNLFSGFLMPHVDMRAFYKWIRYLVPTNYSLETIVSIELGRCEKIGKMMTHGCQLVQMPDVKGVAQPSLELKDFIYKFYGFEYSDRTGNIIVLVGMWVLLQIAIYLTLRFVSHLKR